jgi:hypothetical protein
MMLRQDGPEEHPEHRAPNIDASIQPAGATWLQGLLATANQWTLVWVFEP